MRTAAALLLLLSLSAPGTAGEIVVYSAHGTDIRDEFVASFEALHPGIEVRWLDMGAAQILERVRAEADDPGADVWWGAPSTFFTLAGREGLLEPYRPSWADAAPDYARGQGDLWYGQFDLPIGIGYVPGRVDPPRTWDQLLEEGRGRLLIRDPPASGTMKTFLGAMILRRPDVDAGMDWLRRLHERTVRYTANPEFLFQQLTRGEGDVTVWNVTDLLFQSAKKGHSFEVVLPEEGVPVITDSIALVKGAPEEAEAFYEHVTSIDANLSLAEGHFRFPVRRDLPDDRRPDWMDRMEYEPLDVDRMEMVENLEDWVERWEREVRSAGGGGTETTAIVLIGVVAAVSAVLVVTARRRRRHEDV